MHKTAYFIAISVFAAAALAGCGPRESDASAPRELATDLWDTSGRVYLLYVQDHDVVRARCAADRLIYNHDTCSEIVGRANLGLFHDRLYADFAAPMTTLDSDMADLSTRFQELEQEREELFATVPQTVDRTLAPQIAAKERDAFDQATIVTQLQDQIARLHQQLATNDDPDDRAQLATLETQRIDAQTKLDALKEQLQTLRQAYIAANAASFEPHRLERLQSEWALRLSQMRDRRAQMGQVSESLIIVDELIASIIHRGFTDSYLLKMTIPPAERAVIARMRAIFDPLDPAVRTFTGTMASNYKAVLIHVMLHGKLEDFTCQIATECGTSNLWIDVEGPTINRRAPGPTVHVTPDAVSHPNLEDVRQVADWYGVWRISEETCTGMITRATCAIRLAP